MRAVSCVRLLCAWRSGGACYSGVVLVLRMGRGLDASRKWRKRRRRPSRDRPLISAF